MGDLLQLIFFGHVHKWTQVKEEDLVRSMSDRKQFFTEYTLKCEKCGNMKTFNTLGQRG